MSSILKGLSTSTFVATRVALIAVAGVVAVGAAVAIKEKFTGSEDDELCVETEEVLEGEVVED